MYHSLHVIQSRTRQASSLTQSESTVMKTDTDGIKRAFRFSMNQLKMEARMERIGFEEAVGISRSLLDRWRQYCQERTKLLSGV